MAEESKQSGLVSDQSESGRSISTASLEDSFSDLEDSLDFDIYVEDIPLIAEDNSDLPGNETIPPGHFIDPSSENSGPIPLNLRSFKESDSDDYPEIGSKQFTEDDLDDLLLKDSKTEQLDEDESIALSASELDNITSDNDDYLYNNEDSFESKFQSSGKSGFSSDDSFDAEDLNDTYDTDFGDDDNITLGSDELDHILNPDENEEEDNEFDTKSFFDSESEEEDESIALSTEELDNITNTDETASDDFETDNFISEPPADLFDSNESSDEEIALSGDELSNLLESGNIDDEEIEEEGEAKSFFDSEEEDEEIALSADELNNITSTEYEEEDGIQTDDLSTGIESNEYGVSTESVFGETESSEEDEDISLSSDELDNILESSEVEEEEEFDLENAKSFFDSDDENLDGEEDESISLSPDELGNITADQDFEVEDMESSEPVSAEEDNFDLSDSTQDLEMQSSPNLFEENEVEDEDIALSGDELNNLLESGEIETEEAESLGDSLFEEGAEEDESISLSPDELGNITAEEEFELDSSSPELTSSEEDDFDLSDSTQDLEMESSPSLFEEKVEDEEIALSGDELNNLLESGEIETEEAESLGDSFFEENAEEDESISLSPDELGNITAGEEFEVENVDTSSAAQEDNFDLSDTSDEIEFDAPSDLFGENAVAEDEEIALSGDELNNLLESGEIETETEPGAVSTPEEYDNPIDSGMVIGDDDFVIDEDTSSLSSLSDLGSDISIEDNADYSDTIDSFHFGNVKKEELKKVISYMDELLGSLPDSYIKEFASSEYFELYKKIMNELEL